MDVLIEFFQYPFAIKALLASMMVGLMCGVLGCFIVLRNMALIGDALSHAILPGIVVAFLLVGYSTVAFFVGAVIAGLAAAFAMTWIQQKIQTKNDAAIGIVFTCMFALGVIGISFISKNYKAHLDLKDFLFGSILGIANEDMYLIFFILIYVLISVIFFYRYLFASTFQPVVAKTMGIPIHWMHYYIMLLLSLVVVASLRTVGVILVVAMLITPSSTALLLSDRLKRVLFLSGLIGMCSAIIGLVLSRLFETTPGPMMTVVATLFYLLAAIFSPKKGLIVKELKKWDLKNSILREDILKETFKIGKGQKISIAALSDKLDVSEFRLKKVSRKLIKSNLLSLSNKQILLSAKGIEKSQELVRAHRLWETYMVNKMGMSKEQIHAEAERIEHYLPNEVLDEIDAELGYPQLDPHGSPIPSRRPRSEVLLSKLEVQSIAQVSKHQQPAYVAQQLWELGLQPNQSIRLLEKNAHQVIIQIVSSDETINISQNFANMIYVTEVAVTNTSIS